MEIAAAIAAVSNGLGIAKTMRSVEKSFDEATYKAKVADVIEALTDAKLGLADAKEQLAEYEKEIARLKSNFETRGTLVVADGDYKYFADGDGEPLGYPICPRCEALDGRIVQLKQDGGLMHGRCPACSTKFSPLVAYFTEGEKAKWKAEKERKAKESAEQLRELGRDLA